MSEVHGLIQGSDKARFVLVWWRNIESPELPVVDFSSGIEQGFDDGVLGALSGPLVAGELSFVPSDNPQPQHSTNAAFDCARCKCHL